MVLELTLLALVWLLGLTAVHRWYRRRRGGPSLSSAPLCSGSSSISAYASGCLALEGESPGATSSSAATLVIEIGGGDIGSQWWA